jgi:hypothetical protein
MIYSYLYSLKELPFQVDQKMGSRPPIGFSAALLQEKMHRIQKEFPAWIQKSGKQAKAAPLMQKLSTLLKEKKWQELDEIADQVLSMMAQGEKP